MKLYILEQWTHDFGDSYSDILGVYSSLDKARDYIDLAGYRYEDTFFQECSEYLETYLKEDYVHKTISILERELNKDLGELVFEAVGTKINNEKFAESSVKYSEKGIVVDIMKGDI